jgi:hypothetical protein
MKHACLFFDQVNIYAKMLCDSYANGIPSTDLSTDIVDKVAAGLLCGLAERAPGCGRRKKSQHCLLSEKL